MVALFGAGALGLLAYKENYTTTGLFTKRTESVDGFKAMQAAFPAGVLAPRIWSSSVATAGCGPRT